MKDLPVVGSSGTPTEIKASAIASLESLLNQSFPVPEGKSFFDDFPIWSESSTADVHRLGIQDGERMLASACMRIASYHAPASQFKLGIIGAVACDPSMRGRGVAPALVEALTQTASKSGAAACVLWGSEHRLYQKIGFELSGIQARVPLALLKEEKQIPGVVRYGWRSTVFEMMRNRFAGLVVEPKDSQWLSRHRNVQWLTLETTQGPISYVGFNRGIDLHGMVHEWGGDMAGVRTLLKNVRDQIPSAEILGPPEKINELGLSVDSAHLEYLCMAKLLNPGDLLAGFFPKEAFHLSRVQDRWSLQLGPNSIKSVTSAELSELLLGPRKPQGAAIQSLPLPLWFWGLDSA